MIPRMDVNKAFEILRGIRSDEVEERIASELAGSDCPIGDLAAHATDEKEPLSLRGALVRTFVLRLETPENDTCLRVLTSMARSKNPGVRTAVAAELASLRQRTDARRILEGLRSDPNPTVSREATDALAAD